MLTINTEPNMERTDQELEKEWNSIDWKEVERSVNRIQGKIFLATKNRDNKTIISYLYFHPKD